MATNGSMVKEAKRQTQINDQTNKQEKNLSILDECVLRLLGKLEPITTPPAPESTDKNPEGSLVPLAELLRKSNSRIEQVVDTINNLIDRLEL